MSNRMEVSWCSMHHNVSTLEIQGPCWERGKPCTLCALEKASAPPSSNLVARLRDMAGYYAMPPSNDALALLLTEAADALEHRSVETGAESVSLDYQLPCDVRLPPSGTIGKGCQLRTLMSAFRVRENLPVEFDDEDARAVRRVLAELHRPRHGVTVSNEHEHATYVDESSEKTSASHEPWCETLQVRSCNCSVENDPHSDLPVETT